MPRTRPPYPAEFRQQLIELVRAGKTPAQLSREATAWFAARDDKTSTPSSNS